MTLTLPDPIPEPAAVEFRTLWRPDLDLWGSVVIHNIERRLDGASGLDRLVDGHPAFRVTPAGGAGETADSVTIDTGVWAIDISLWTGDPTRREGVLEGLLDSLVITERPGQLPRVEDPGGIVGETSELLIAGRGNAGVGFSFAPNCDADPAPGCVAGAGYLYPLEGVVDRVAGVAQLLTPPVQGGPPAALPAGTDIGVTDFGSHTLPLSCDGVPAFDPALLPSGVTAFEAHQSVEVYTGLRFWPARLLPGSEIHRAGGFDTPSAVATHERTADGTWRTVSVTACR